MQFLIPLTVAFLVTPSFSLATRAHDSGISAQNVTVQSLIYGIPLTEYVIFANSIANRTGAWTTNALHHETTLANASYHAVVLPNVDTLYSEGILDLSGGDPHYDYASFGGRAFLCLALLRSVTTAITWCNIGTITNSTAGKYLIKYRASNPGCAAAASGDYAGTIYLPTVYGATLLRIEVANSTDADYVVSSIQPGFTLQAGPAASKARAPALTAALLNANLTTSNPPLYIMQLTARVAAYNPPEVAADVPSITTTLEAAGPPARCRLEPSDFVSLGDGWTALALPLCGDFQSHYDVRARFVAVQAYLQLQASEAIYPLYEINQDTYANQTYMVNFSATAVERVLSSLTMYGGDGVFGAQQPRPYSLNKRGNMTIQMATPRLWEREVRRTARSRFICCCRARTSRHRREWESNWLPTPADEEGNSASICAGMARRSRSATGPTRIPRSRWWRLIHHFQARAKRCDPSVD
ncbi:hypothetical protein B0H14DRAFT_3616048 [Mycena olivaceomarginata]|nr:hypothetical protein B0H14DRAFT_3616048 [Mycena olivaceomarginata]